MSSAPLAELQRLVADIADASSDEIEARLGDAARVQSWVASREAALLTRAAELNNEGAGLDPEDAIRKQQRASSSNARKKAKRAAAATQAPAVGAALEGGETTAEHLDALANAASGLPSEQQDQLFDLANQQPSAAANLSVDGYRRHLAKLVDKVRRDEGLDRLAEQRRNTKLRKWVNNKTGMFILNGEFEPELGQRIFTAIDSEVERQWRASTNGVTDSTAMPDITRRNDQLTAYALGALATSGHSGECSSVPDISILIDAATLESGIHDDSVSETALGAYLPPDTIRRLACDAHVTPVIRRGDGTVLDVGRKVRTANRAQRRALRAMYRTCAFDGCTKPFDWCEMHHVVPWTSFGPTDLDNLLPLCHLHHHKVHEGRWTLKLLPDRTLKIYRPNGEHFSTTGPPKLRHVDRPDRSADREPVPA